LETSPKSKFFRFEESERKWFVVDVQGKTLGRAASRIAHVLRGKHKPTFTPNSDQGDFVIVVNADKVIVTGKRPELKTYFRHSGYPGGDRVSQFKEISSKNPEWIMENAVKGMLPKNRLGRKMIKKLKVYRGSEHPHVPQKPETLVID